jgi:hypothetical protein
MDLCGAVKIWVQLSDYLIFNNLIFIIVEMDIF